MHGIIHHSSGARASHSLAVRGGLARTFGGLAAFVAVTFLSWGLYILQGAFADPLKETAAAVIVAALMIALAAILLFFLLKPVKRARPPSPAKASVATALPLTALEATPDLVRLRPSCNLPYQRIYVDHSLIRP